MPVLMSNLGHRMFEAHRRLRCLSAQLRSNRAVPQASWSFKKRRPALSTTDIADLEVSADDTELTAKAAAIYHVHGCARTANLPTVNAYAHRMNVE